MIEIITGQDVRDMYLETEHGTFTPIYEYEHYDQETDSYTGFKVIKTAEEVYSEWLDNKDRPPIVEPSKMEVLQRQIDELKLENQKLWDTCNHLINVNLDLQDLIHRPQQIPNIV